MSLSPFSFIVAAVLALSPVLAAGAPSPKTGDVGEIPAAQVPDSPVVKASFENLRREFQPMLAKVNATQQNFNKGIVTDGGARMFSNDDLDGIGKVLHTIFKSADRYQQIINDPRMDERDKAKAIHDLLHQQQARMAELAKGGSFSALIAKKWSDGANLENMVRDLSSDQTRGKTLPVVAGESDPEHSGDSAHKPETELSQDAHSGPPEKVEGRGHGPQREEGDEQLVLKVTQKAVRDAFSTGQVPENPPSGNANLPNLGTVIGLPNDPQDPSSAVDQAHDQIFKGDLDGALASYDQAAQLGAGAPAVAAKSGLELDMKDYGGAMRDALAALQMDPSNKEALAVYHFAKDHGDGSGPAAANLTGERGFASAGGARGGAIAYGPAGSGGSAAAQAAAARLTGAQAQKAGAEALKVGDASGALAYLDRALTLDPNNPAALNLRAAVFARLHQYDRAAADARAGLALAPGSRPLLRTLAYSQLRGKDYKGALETSNELLAADPSDAYAFAMRAHAYGDLGDRDAMMSDIDRAAQLDPRFAQAAAAAGSLQLPSNSDVLFLFPGEAGPRTAAAQTAAAPSSRNRRFGAVAGVALAGGLLLALGLLKTVLAPLKEQVTSVFTRVTGGTPAAAAELDTAQPASAAGHMPGLIRGQYEITRQIGAGGMGMVFEGNDRSLGRRVAIKKMRDELRVNPQERARFVIEAKTVAALHHPGIVDIYAIAEDGDDVYLIFEYVDGQTVHDVVQRSGRLQTSQALKVIRAAADALSFAHSKGVIHRDMKPSNMMLDAAGRLKVMDFGIARMAKDAMTRYSMTNTVVGTPPYMAPEQEQGQVRRESDVYALAVCAYEMLTGKLPFAGIGAGMLMNKINMSFIPPSRATAGVPEALDAVFQKAFQADPEKRYRTPLEFADALDSAAPVSAGA